MKRYHQIACLVIASSLLLTACGEYKANPLLALNAASVETGSDLAPQAKALFESKCLACHDSNNLGGTGLTYVGNLNLLAQSPYVIPGNPTSSPLFERTVDGTMPPGAPLSQVELGLIKDWIISLQEPQANLPPPTTGTPPTVPTPIPTPNPLPSPTPPMAPSPTPSPVAMVTYTMVADNVLTPRCVSCHGKSGGYSFSSYVGTMKAVKAGDPLGSRLYDSVSKGRMPPGRALTQQQLKIIYDWIQQGALNN